jgi:glycosyltransferase involved in cell wall biosynthesis
MRIAYVCADPGIPVFGHKGGSVHVQEVVRGLRKRGARVDLFAGRLGGRTPVDFRDLAVIEIPIDRASDAAVRERACLDSNRLFSSVLAERGPFDLVYERHSLFAFAGMEYARRSGVPGLLEVNAPLVVEQATYRRLVDRAAAEEAARRAFTAASAILAVSRDLADRLEESSSLAGCVHVVPNGVDPDRFPAGLVPARPKSPGEFVVGFVGSLKPWHGLTVLAEAFRLLSARRPHARLLVVGGGAGRAELEARIRAVGLEAKATFAGMVSPVDVPRWLASMDVAVAPYPRLADFYFSPLKLYEYMAAGLPVVASRIGQIGQAIVDGLTGVLCPPGDAEAFAAALDALSADEGLRFRLGREARREVLRSHTWTSVAERILEIGSGVRPSARIEALA